MCGAHRHCPWPRQAQGLVGQTGNQMYKTTKGQLIGLEKFQEAPKGFLKKCQTVTTCKY